jgi:hypothetical protein
MSSVLFLFAVGAVLLLAVWLIRNDAPGLGGGDKGLFGMKPTDAPRDTPNQNVRWRRR